MARGFESKDVEYQQAEKEREPAKAREQSATERDATRRRRSIELALVRSRSELAAAVSPVHRRMLEQAIADLERQLTTDV